jgi:FkbM family methyltransferase
VKEKYRKFLIDHVPAKILTALANVVTFPVSIYYRLRHYPHLILRKGTSDLTVFRKIFVSKEYDIQYKEEPELIIDGGANVGYASIFFANRFPSAQIIAIEPESSNFEALVNNVSKYDNVTTVKKGLWNKSGFLRIIDKESDKFAFMTMEVSAGDEYDVEVITIDEILRLSGCSEIGILKLDIEGAEKELFSSNYDSWLGKVKLLIIELHDDMKSGCSDAFYAAINHYKFESEVVGENIVLRKKT